MNGKQLYELIKGGLDMYKITLLLFVFVIVLQFSSAGAESRDTLYIYPAGPGDYNDIGFKGDISSWNCVDDIHFHPNDGEDYLKKTGSNWANSLFRVKLSNENTGDILKIVLHFRVKSIDGRLKGIYKTGDEIYTVGETDRWRWTEHHDKWGNIQWELPKNNPETGKKWTWEEVKQLEIGLRAKCGTTWSPDYLICTQIYGEITYDTKTPITKKSIIIETKQEEATIIFNNVEKRSPATYHDVEPGIYKLVMKKEGYIEEQTTISINEDQYFFFELTAGTPIAEQTKKENTDQKNIYIFISLIFLVAVIYSIWRGKSKAKKSNDVNLTSMQWNNIDKKEMKKKWEAYRENSYSYEAYNEYHGTIYAVQTTKRLADGTIPVKVGKTTKRAINRIKRDAFDKDAKILKEWKISSFSKNELDKKLSLSEEKAHKIAEDYSINKKGEVFYFINHEIISNFLRAVPFNEWQH